jgi:hypothetical protein
MTKEPYWDSDSEKLRCHIVLDDDAAQKLSSRAGNAYFRAFIVENRATHQIGMKFRYKYRNPEERQWYFVTTDKPGEEGVEDFVFGIRSVLLTGAAMMHVELRDDQIVEFYPPDDGGDSTKTIIWLEMQDLIEISEVREIPLAADGPV